MCYNIDVRELSYFHLRSLTNTSERSKLEKRTVFQVGSFVTFAMRSRTGVSNRTKLLKTKERHGHIYENNDSSETSYH